MDGSTIQCRALVRLGNGEMRTYNYTSYIVTVVGEPVSYMQSKFKVVVRPDVGVVL